MTTSIFSSLFDEASTATSPQLRAAEITAVEDRRPASSVRAVNLDAVGRDRRQAALPKPRSPIVALATELEASEARARRAEQQLAAHDRHCICRAAEIAAEVAEEETVTEAGGAQMNGCIAWTGISPHRRSTSSASQPASPPSHRFRYRADLICRP